MFIDVKMRLYVDDSLLQYISNYCFGARAGDPNYIVEFDVNGDGIINVLDVAWFSQRHLTWVETPVTLNAMLVPAVLGLGGLAVGYLVATAL